MNQTIQNSLQSADEEQRRTAVQSLRGASLCDVASLLLQAMGDVSWRVRKEAVDIFVNANVEQEQIAMLLELFRSEDNAGQRNSAAEAVSRLGVKALSLLIDRLHDSDADVRKFVIDVMGTIHCKETMQSLVEALDDPDINVASAAAEQLGNLGDGAAVPHLLAAIANNKADFFRFNALAAIGRLAAPAPVPPEINALTSNELLRKPVYECLGSIGDETAVDTLLDGILTGSRNSRNAALIAIYRIYQRSSVAAKELIKGVLESYKDSNMVSIIIDSFSLNDVIRGEAIINILELIGDNRAASVFIHAFANERLSDSALNAVKRLCPEIMGSILSLYSGNNDAARTAICMLCAECPYNGLTQAQIIDEALDDLSPQVRQAAAIAVGKLGFYTCIKKLVALLDDEDSAVYNSATESLQSLALLHQSEISGIVFELAKNEHPHRRRVAALLAAAVGDVERLLLLVKDENSQVRQAAVSAIRICRKSDIDSILIMALVDEDPDVRIAAAESIGEIGSLTLVKPLLSALSDDDVWVQCAVMKSLVAIDMECGFKEIEKIFPSASGLLLITMLQLLETIASEAAYKLVESVLKHPDRDISTLASEIIACRPSFQESE